MDQWFGVQREQAPKVGQIPQWPDKGEKDESSPVVTKGAPAPEEEVPPKPEAKPEVEAESKGRVGGVTRKSPEEPKAPEPTAVPEGMLGDEELDAIQLRPNTHAKTRGEFHNLKLKTKEYKDKWSTVLQERDQIKNELAQIKANGAVPSDPAIKARLDRAEEVLRTFDLPNSSEYQEKFAAPLSKKWDRVVDDLTDALARGFPNDPKVQEFRDQLKLAGPDHPGLDKAWWNQQLKNLPEDYEDDKADIRAQLRDITATRRERDRFVREVGSDAERFTKFQQAQFSGYQKQYNDAMPVAVGKLIPELKIGEWGLQKNLESAKNDAERKEFEAHNQRWNDYRQQFEKTIGDIFAPEVDDKGVTKVQKHARIALQVVKATHLEGENADLQKQLSAAQKRIQALEAQVTQRASAGSRLERSNGAPTHKPTSTPEQTRGRNSRDRAANAMNDFMRERGVLKE